MATDTGEVRVVDPNTGGEKGSKLARFSLIPSDFLWALAEHYGRGARKYEDRNWERGYKWSLSLDAMNRHLHQWLLGEDNDEETGSSHLIAAAWHLIALWWFHHHGKGTDDVRPAQATSTITGVSGNPAGSVMRYAPQVGESAHHWTACSPPHCCEVNKVGLSCTRSKNHTGSHVACGTDTVLAVWPNMEVPR